MTSRLMKEKYKFKKAGFLVRIRINCHILGLFSEGAGSLTKS